MKILCPLSNWQERIAERGRGAGKRIRQRYILAADKWTWIVGVQTGDGTKPVVCEKFYGNMKCLISSLDPNIVPIIIAALCKALKKNVEMPDSKNPAVIGKWIDDNFNTSFLREYPPKVFQSIFKTDDDGEGETADEIRDHN